MKPIISNTLWILFMIGVGMLGSILLIKNLLFLIVLGLGTYAFFRIFTYSK